MRAQGGGSRKRPASLCQSVPGSLAHRAAGAGGPGNIVHLPALRRHDGGGHLRGGGLADLGGLPVGQNRQLLNAAPLIDHQLHLHRAAVALGLGLVAFIFDTVGGVLFAKLLNLFCKNKINPMIGAAGISAFPMSARVVHKMGLAEDNQNFLLMHAVGVNVSGQIASVIAGGMILGFFG